MTTTRPVSFRCPLPFWAQIKKHRLNRTEGLVRLLRRGLELEEVIEGLGKDLDELAEVIGYDRVTVIRECVRGMIELVKAAEGEAVTPLLLEEYAVGLKRQAAEMRLKAPVGEPKKNQKISALEDRAERLKRPLVRLAR